jgi:luciferase family oxidoreductase group 1
MNATVTVPLSVLDLAIVGRGETVRDGLEATVAFARRAEELGYRRVWYAEHHNFASIASSATAVVIANVAAHTERIRLGAGGIMLPNHSPLVVAEQFGTLATLHPDRIDLALGRAPGTDQPTMRALRRDHTAADTFPQDVVELQGYLGDESRIPGVEAIPGKGTHVPLYILGSSLYGAQLAALLGLPYGFASHFAPQALHQAVAVYRDRFEPSAQIDRPYVMAGVNVLAADTDESAADLLSVTRRSRVRNLFGRNGRTFTDEEADAVLASPQGRHVDEMMTYTASGTAEAVAAYLQRFADDVGADELITVHGAPTAADRIRSLELLASTVEPALVRSSGV